MGGAATAFALGLAFGADGVRGLRGARGLGAGFSDTG